MQVTNLSRYAVSIRIDLCFPKCHFRLFELLFYEREPVLAQQEPERRFLEERLRGLERKL
jgi:hypothetical protein